MKHKLKKKTTTTTKQKQKQKNLRTMFRYYNLKTTYTFLLLLNTSKNDQEIMYKDIIPWAS